MDYLNLPESKLSTIVEHLNQFLADAHVHYQNLRQAHWMVEGSLFFPLHAAYEADYDAVKVHIDEVAERVRALRRQPEAHLSAYLDMAKVQEMERNANPFVQMRTLLHDKKLLIADLRAVLQAAQEADDEGTIDLCGGVLSALEKRAWMYQAWVNEQQTVDKALREAKTESA
jgi:starvation-inducible DNA-binding protein